MRKLVCIVCPVGCRLEVELAQMAIKGNKCPRGIKYAKDELTAPKRVVTSTVKIKGGIYKRLPVKTNGDIPKEIVFECIKEINKVEVESPINIGEVIIKNVLGSNIDIVATRKM